MTTNHEWAFVSSAWWGTFQWCARCGCVRHSKESPSYATDDAVEVRHFVPGRDYRANLNEGGSAETPVCQFRKPASL